MTAIRRAMATRRLIHPAILALVAFLPPLWSAPGKIAADTKSYLSINPWGLLQQATQLWDSSTGLGTVTHQTIGYLFPMGPWWAAADVAGIPDWLTQRVWWGALVFTALLGAFRLAGDTNSTRHAQYVTALSYGLSPYLFAYVSRISAILLPWAVFPWMILVLRRGLKEPTSWRHPALFAVLVLISGTVNATAIAFVTLGAVVWLLVESTAIRDVWHVVFRSAVLSAVVSVWWVTALIVQGRYGINILRYTETYETITSTALPSELLRGFGYWFSYGGDWLDPWVEATYGLLARPWYLALGFVIVGLSVIGVRHASRASRLPSAMLIIVGLSLAVGEASTGTLSPWGQSFGALVDLGPGLVVRSTQRALPVLILGLAFGLGGWVNRRSAPQLQLKTAFLLGAVTVQAAPWFLGGIATSAITHSTIPPYWNEASASLGLSVDYRVWETPGTDFASYRWGGTIDPILPGLTDRPTVARELIPLGTDGAADLVSEIERRVAENTLSERAIAPLARVLSSDTILARNDLEFERYALARPDDVTNRVDRSTETTRLFTGPLYSHDQHLIDEQTYGGVPGIGEVPSIATWAIDEPVSILSARTGAVAVVHGSAETIVGLAEAGLISGNELLFDADSMTSDDSLQRQTDWTIIGDSNRLEDRRWYSVGAVLGATRSDDELVNDSSIRSLRVVDDTTRLTTSELQGGFSSVRASNYGSPAVLTAEDRPEHAIDGDAFTAWRGSALAPTTDLTWEGQLAQVANPQWIELLQPTTGERSRWITEVELTLRHGAAINVVRIPLDDRSRSGNGQRIDLDGSPVSSIEIEIIKDSVGPLPGYGNSVGVGFAEITIDGVGPTTEWITLPVDIRSASDAEHRTTFVLERRRIDETFGNRFDPEAVLHRRLDVSADTTFQLSGSWSHAAHFPDAGVRASSPSLVGVSELRWVSEIDPEEIWFEVNVESAPQSALIELATGDLFSVPTALTVQDMLGNFVDAKVPSHGVVALDLTGLTPGTFRVTFRDLDERTTVDRFADRRRILPVGVARSTLLPEIDSMTVTLPTECTNGLISIDGNDVPIRATASGFVGCTAVALTAGSHEISTAAGHRTGWNINRVILDSDPAVSDVVVTGLEMTRSDTRIASAITGEAEWLVLSESASPGWKATIDGVSLGDYRLVNGHAMAWEIPGGLSGEVVIEWTPQRAIRWALIVSSLGIVFVIGCCIRRPRPVNHAPVQSRNAFGIRAAVAITVLSLGPIAVLAPAITKLRPRLQLLMLGTPMAAMWAWTSVRQIRWDMPVDLVWPQSMSWGQHIVILAVTTAIWPVLRRSDRQASDSDGPHNDNSAAASGTD